MIEFLGIGTVAIYLICAIIGGIVGYVILFFIIKHSVKNGVKAALIELGIADQDTIKKTTEGPWMKKDSWMEKYYKKKT